jgi:hypothetical protein
VSARRRITWRLLAAAPLLLASQPGCSLGQGTGKVHSDRLIAKDCWGIDGTDAEYDLQPDFFAAIPYRNTMQIRVQRGNDLHEVSDGLSVLVTDVERIRGDLKGKSLCVSLPPGVAPPGTPEGAELDDPPSGGTSNDGGVIDFPTDGGVIVDPSSIIQCDAPLVHMSLYLQQSCHNQNIVLYAVSGKITFNELFSNDPNEADAAEKYTDAEFEVLVGDPRDVALGDPVEAIPADKLTKLVGFFRFYFERGQPGQPFP